MKKILASLLCLLLCASLACCGAEKNENNDATNSTASSTGNLKLNYGKEPQSNDELLARVRELWNTLVTNQSKQLVRIIYSANASSTSSDSSSLSFTEEREEIDRLLNLCKSLDLDGLHVVAEQDTTGQYSTISKGYDSRHLTFVIGLDSALIESSGILISENGLDGLEFTVVDHEAVLVLLAGNKKYFTAVHCSDELAQNLSEFIQRQ